MKLTISDFEIDIKAKRTRWERTRFNAEDTKAVLNIISLYLSEAATAYENRDRDTMADEARTMANDIYTALSDAGYYNA